MKAAIREGHDEQYVRMDGIDKEDSIANFGGAMRLFGYDTEKDLKRAKKDIERMLMIVAERSVFDIIKFLAPYRAKICKRKLMQAEYDNMTKEEGK